MRLLPALMALLLAGVYIPQPVNPAPPATETHAFTAKWRPHEMLLGGAPAYSYGTSWTLKVPAPSEKPVYVDIRALSTYVYKHTAQDLSGSANEVAFLGRTRVVRIYLEGVLILDSSDALIDIGAILGPYAWFWGPGRPKARDRVPMHGRSLQDLSEPSEGTWELRIEAVTHFGFKSDGAARFGQFLKQRITGIILYAYE